MIIERFFGKGRTDQAQDQAQAQAKPRAKDKDPSQEKVKEETKPRRASGNPAAAGAAAPRIEATDAPASLARSGEAPGARPATVVPVAVAPVPDPSNEEIAARAYDLWMRQGRPAGCEQANWIEAERQLRAERTPR